jgi:CheY-like chemotaxis protein
MAQDKILIVEDNKLNLRLTDFILRSKGYEVFSARNAQECLDACRKEKPAVILMDLQLPGVDGLTLTRQLKSAPETQDILIVAVTARAMKTDREKALEAGCDSYISKPIDTQKLPEIIEQLIQTRTAGN